MADYLEAFARESEEQITELNNALLEFEDDPTDEAAMEGIFRTAHTLKGNCGAMGFDEAEDLAHAIEDLLEAIRSNRVSVSPELMDAIFEGVDELDAMISEAVEEGEVRREADDVIATLREYAAADGLAEPTDAAIDDLLASVSGPSDSQHSVYHVRLDVAGDPAVHGRAVVDALDDAFELLGTDPGGDSIDAGDYDGTIDAAFASVVTRAAVEAALEPVDAVDDQVIADVTDRAEEESSAPEEATGVAAGGDAAPADPSEAADLSVDELLEDEDVDQFDDLDEMAEEVGDTSQFEDLGDAGSFADLGITEDDVDIGTGDAASAEADAEASAGNASADAEAEASADDDEVEDAAAEFAQLKEEVEPVGFDELQNELADLEFDEYDSDEEVGFDELLDEEELSAEGAFATVEDQAPAAAADVDADDVEAEASAGEESVEPDATAEDLFGSAEADEAAEASAASADADDSAAEQPVASADADADVEADQRAVDAGPAADEPAADESIDDEAAAAASDDEESAETEPSQDEAAAEPVEDEAAAEPIEDEAAAESTADGAAVDAADLLDSESLDESAQSFGEGGLDLSEESTDAAAANDAVPAGAEDLDLDESFGGEAAEADVETGEANATEAFDLGEDDIDFGAGTVPGADASEEETAEEAVASGDALEDDSFDPDATEAALDADAGSTEDGTEVEPVEGFGEEDGVLDLDSSSVAADEAPPEGDEDSLEAVDVEDVGPGAAVPDDAEAGFEGSIDEESAAESPTDEEAAADVDAIADPGFSDGPASGAGDEGPDVDEERLERIRTLGVPTRDEDAAARSAGTQSIRVDVESLDRMLNMVEGLVTSRARLRRALIENEPREVLEDELDDLEDVTSELQDTVMDVRLVPLRTAVNKLPRIVRDVAREEDKQVDFEMVGEDVEIDRSILDEIGDPLVHLVRNAVDHGIETPEVREEAGKPAEGSVELRATRGRDRVTIEVEDDGAGIDADAVRDAAVEEGIHTRSEVDSMDDDEIHELIFHAGFSTAAEVTDVSGRGVGMDVVAETVDRLDGSVTVESEPGEGTTISMELPVTLAIAEVLFVDVGGEEYGIPIKNVDEIGPVVGVETQDGQEVLVSDGGEDRRELIRLDEALSTPGRSDPNTGMLVHLRDDVREAAIHCDQVREQQEVVVKPFEGVLGDVPGLSGASVLGDGDVVTILDVETL